ncbi:hypothetical protein C8R44DRAFT_865522 [Mycena epipterygia]|nr:hypothetical protein C8R44DRAFT_865522 [Mycena epipterygia]
MKNAAIKKVKLEHKLKTLERSLAQAQKTGNIADKGEASRRDHRDREAARRPRRPSTLRGGSTNRSVSRSLYCDAKKAAPKDRKGAKYQTALLKCTKIDAEFLKLKEETSMVSAASKQLLTDLRKTCARKEIESARLEHENLVAQVEKDNVPLTDCNVKVQHSMEELKKQEANLEMNGDTNCNPEKCKADIAKHEKTNEGMQRRADKVERDGCVTCVATLISRLVDFISSFQDHWEPALQSLIASIGIPAPCIIQTLGLCPHVHFEQFPPHYTAPLLWAEF